MTRNCPRRRKAKFCWVCKAGGIGRVECELAFYPYKEKSLFELFGML